MVVVVDVSDLRQDKEGPSFGHWAGPHHLTGSAAAPFSALRSGSGTNIATHQEWPPVTQYLPDYN